MPYGQLNVDSVVNSDGVTSGGLYGFKNRIINGAMMIDQRNAGASKTFTAGTNGYALDRWSMGYAAGGSAIVQRVAGPNAYDFAMQVQPQTGNTQTNIEQPIELNNCVDLSGGSVTVSGKVYVDSTASGSAQLFYYYYPTNGGTQTFVSLGAVTLTAGQYVSFSKTFTCPTLFPSTASDPSSRGLGLILEMDNAAGRTFKWTNVQLEKGSTATSFDYRPYGAELALCQRYCQMIATAEASGNYLRYAYGECLTTTACQANVNLLATMRISPSLTTSTASLYSVFSRANSTTCTVLAISADGSSPAVAGVIGTVASGLTVGSAGAIMSNNNKNSYLLYTAEL